MVKCVTAPSIDGCTEMHPVCAYVSQLHAACRSLTQLLHSRHQNSVKARIAAEYVGVELEVVETKMGETNKTPEFLKLNPAGRVLLQLPSIDHFPHGTIAPDGLLLTYRSSLVDLTWADIHPLGVCSGSSRLSPSLWASTLHVKTVACWHPHQLFLRARPPREKGRVCPARLHWQTGPRREPA